MDWVHLIHVKSLWVWVCETMWCSMFHNLSYDFNICSESASCPLSLALSLVTTASLRHTSLALIGSETPETALIGRLGAPEHQWTLKTRKRNLLSLWQRGLEIWWQSKPHIFSGSWSSIQIMSNTPRYWISSLFSTDLSHKYINEEFLEQKLS